MKDRLTFSILTTTYNRVDSGYLEENIRAVQNQKPGNFTYEHIIIDDGSTDSTKQFVQKMISSDKRIKYVYQENSGPAVAIQKGIQRAQGDYILIIDDDDYLSRDSLYIRKKYIEVFPDVDFFYGKADWVDEYSLPINVLFQSKNYEENLYDQLLITNCIHGGTPTVRSTLLKSITWPKWVDRSQDYFMWLEIMKPENKATVKYIDDVLINYRFHTSGYTAGINSEEKKKAKAAINQHIRDSHDSDKMYLANQARYWLDEAHATNNFRLEQIRQKDAQIEELHRALEYYTLSRVVKVTVKARNVLRGQVLDRIGRAVTKYSARLDMPRSFIKIANEKWDSSKPLVSIISPVYNRKTFLPDAIQSVLKQTFQDFEYIIVDDGSTNKETLDYLKKVSHPKIKVLQKQNGGVASARNAGVDASSGKYIICLDDDDILEPTYVEKAVLFLEANQFLDIITYNMQMFGKIDSPFIHDDYNPIGLIENNMVITAAVTRRQVWESTGGYKSDIGYEDWEYWLNAAEKGHLGYKIPEKLFRYRTADNSRYVEDLQRHSINTSSIKKLHPHYITNIKRIMKSKSEAQLSSAATALANLGSPEQYLPVLKHKSHVLIAVPWLPFGGAEMYTYNFMNHLSADYEFSIVTGIKDDHVWEENFYQITPRIYHLANLYPSEDYYPEFIMNYIRTRDVSILHVVHAGYPLKYLDRIKKEFPKLKVVVTMFNDRVEEYVENTRKQQLNIDALTSDNKQAIEGITQRFTKHVTQRVIPNGIDTENKFNPDNKNRLQERAHLNILSDELVTVFIGRLSDEKNPDIFLEAAEIYSKAQGVENMRFLMAGDGPLRSAVLKTIKSERESRIDFLGYRTSDEIVSLLAAADIFVLPSSIEGFPVALAEAMSMKLVPIATSVGAVPEVISHGKNGFITKPGDAKDIAANLVYISKNLDKISTLKTNARSTIEKKCTTDNMASEYRTLYKGLIEDEDQYVKQ